MGDPVMGRVILSVSTTVFHPPTVTHAAELTPITTSPTVGAFLKGSNYSNLEGPVTDGAVSTSVVSFFPINAVIKHPPSMRNIRSAYSASAPIALPFLPVG